VRLVVLDTNFIVSAGIHPKSAPAKLVMDWILDGQVQTVTSPWIVDEYRDVVRRAKLRRYGFPPIWLDFLIEESLQLPDPAAWPLDSPDPKDMPFPALARESGAWLVTGNLRHFPRAIRNEVVVRSPANYLEYLEKRAEPGA
jgi:putative PIN family toxin of toxin-antitoxin system